MAGSQRPLGGCALGLKGILGSLHLAARLALHLRHEQSPPRPLFFQVLLDLKRVPRDQNVEGQTLGRLLRAQRLRPLSNQGGQLGPRLFLDPGHGTVVASVDLVARPVLCLRHLPLPLAGGLDRLDQRSQPRIMLVSQRLQLHVQRHLLRDVRVGQRSRMRVHRCLRPLPQRLDFQQRRLPLTLFSRQRRRDRPPFCPEGKRVGRGCRLLDAEESQSPLAGQPRFQRLSCTPIMLVQRRLVLCLQRFPCHLCVVLEDLHSPLACVAQRLWVCSVVLGQCVCQVLGLSGHSTCQTLLLGVDCCLQRVACTRPMDLEIEFQLGPHGRLFGLQQRLFMEREQRL